MRGIVTLAAAYALPSNFPNRDLILLIAFCVVVRAGLQVLDDDQSKEAEVIRSELESQLTELRDESKDINELDQYSSLRVRVVAAQRKALLEMRSKYEIGADAFHQVEAQLDVAEVNALGAEYP